MSAEERDEASRIQSLEQLARIAFDAVRTIDDWLGQASTRTSAEDAMGRLRRALEEEGFEDPVHHNQEWKRSLLDAMDRAGIGCGHDDEIRLRTALDKSWMRATGPRVRDLLSSAEPAAISEDPLCPRCGRERMWIEVEMCVRITAVAGGGQAPFDVVETEPTHEIVDWNATGRAGVLRAVGRARSVKCWTFADAGV